MSGARESFTATATNSQLDGPAASRSRSRSRSRASVSASRSSVSSVSRASAAAASSRSRLASLASELSSMRSRSSLQAARASISVVSASQEEQRSLAQASAARASASVSRAEASRNAAFLQSASAASISSEMASIEDVIATATIATGQASALAIVASLTAVTATATGSVASAALASLAEAANTLSTLAQSDLDVASSLVAAVDEATATSSTTSSAGDAISTTAAQTARAAAGLSRGQIAAIILSILAGVLALLLVGLFFLRKRHASSAERPGEGWRGASIFPWRQDTVHSRRISDRYASGWAGEKTSYDDQVVQGTHQHSQGDGLYGGTDGYLASGNGSAGNGMRYDPYGREVDDRWDGDNLTRGGPTRQGDYLDTDIGEGSDLLATAGRRGSSPDDDDSDRDEARQTRPASPPAERVANVPTRPSRHGVSMDARPTSSSSTSERASRPAEDKSRRTLSGIGALLMGAGGLLGGALSRRKETPAAPRFPIEDDDEDEEYERRTQSDDHLQSDAEKIAGFYGDIDNKRGERARKGTAATIVSSDLRYRQTPQPPPMGTPKSTNNKGWGGWSAALAGSAAGATGSGGRYTATRHRKADSSSRGWSGYNNDDDDDADGYDYDEDDRDSLTTVQFPLNRGDHESGTESDGDGENEDDTERDDELKDLDEDYYHRPRRRPTARSSCATAGGQSRPVSWDTSVEGTIRTDYEDEDRDHHDDDRNYTSPTAAVLHRLSIASRERKMAPSSQVRENPFQRPNYLEAGEDGTRLSSLPGHSSKGLGLSDTGIQPPTSSSRQQFSSASQRRENTGRLAAVGAVGVGGSALTGLAAKHRLSHGSTYSRGYYPLEPSSSVNSGKGPSRHSTFLSSGTNLLGPEAIASRSNSQQRYFAESSRERSGRWQAGKVDGDDDEEEEEEEEEEGRGEEESPNFPQRGLRPQLSTIFSEIEAGSASPVAARRQSSPHRGDETDFTVEPLAVKKRSPTVSSPLRASTSNTFVSSRQSDEMLPPAYTSQDGGGRMSASRRAASMEAVQSQTGRSTSDWRDEPTIRSETTGDTIGGLLSGFTAGLKRLTSNLTPASRSPAIGSSEGEEAHASDHPQLRRLARSDRAKRPLAEPDEGDRRGIAQANVRNVSSPARIACEAVENDRRDRKGRQSTTQTSEERSVSSFGHASFGVGRTRTNARTGGGSRRSRAVTTRNSEERTSSVTGDSTSFATHTRSSSGPSSAAAGAHVQRRSGPSSGGDNDDGHADISSLANSGSKTTEGRARSDGAILGVKETVQRSISTSTRGAASDASKYAASLAEGDGESPEDYEEADSDDTGEAADEATVPYMNGREGADARESTVPTDIMKSPTQWRSSPRVETISKQATEAIAALQQQQQQQQHRRRPGRVYQPSQDMSIITSSSSAASRSSYDIPPPVYGLPDVRRGAMRNSRSGSGDWPNAPPRMSLWQAGHGFGQVGGGVSGVVGGDEKSGMVRDIAPEHTQRPAWFAY